MADIFDGPFGVYTTVGGVLDGTGKDSLAAQMVKFAALYGITLTAGNGVTGAFVLLSEAPNPSPDFDAITLEMRQKMGTELIALWDVCDAAAEA